MAKTIVSKVWDNVIVDGRRYVNAGALTILGAIHTVSAAGVALVQQNTITIADSRHTQGADSVTVSTGSASITYGLVTSRTTGNAPLGVHFDGSSTTTASVTYPFHDLTYFYDYGDTGSGTFSLTTGNSQNTKMGPALGAHIYKTPGSYTASFVVRLGIQWFPSKTARVGVIVWASGNTYQCHTQHTTGASFSATNWTLIATGYVESTLATVSITVTDPAVTFSSAQTICVAGDGDFTGMPAASTQVTTLPVPIPSNRRVLLKSGLATNYGNLQIGQSGFVAGTTNVHVSAWGGGSRPRVEYVHIESDSRSTSHPSEIHISGLDIDEDFSILCSAKDVVFVDNVLTRTPVTCASRIVCGAATGYYGQAARGDNYQLVYWPKNIFISENHAEGVTDGSAVYLLANGVFDRCAVMGNYWRRSDEHTFRTWGSNKLVSSDNHYAGEHREVVRGCWKHQSLGPDNIAEFVYLGANFASRQLCSIDDMIGSVANIGQALCGYGPENLDNRGYQRCYDAVYCRPIFTLGPNTNSCFEPFANNVSMYGAICTNGAIVGHAWKDGESPPEHWLGGPAHPLGPYLHEMGDY